MTRGTLDDRYLRWIYGQVADDKLRRSSQSYWRLLGQMYKTEFTWFVPNDANRAMDGIILRQEWAEEFGYETDRDWMELECSFLEMLLALARRAEFQQGDPAAHWFWFFLQNLGFQDFHDKSRYSMNFVKKRMDVVMQRKYDRDGNGGIFPLPNPIKDQRKVELWYQLCEYLLQE